MLDIASNLMPMLTGAGTRERCGLVLSSGRIVEVNNVADDPIAGFKMNPEQVVKYLESQDDPPIGTWHTHPGQDPNLSELDYAGFMQWRKWKHFIVGTRNGEPCVAVFEIDNDVILIAGEFS